MVSNIDISNLYNNKIKWYNVTKDHWSKTEPTFKGMLGGNNMINQIDISTSRNIIDNLINKKFFKPSNALELGAGIGRVTENLLIEYFDDVTLVEQNKAFVDKAKEKLNYYTNKNNKLNITYLEDSMQSIVDNSNISNKLYSCIWIQWCIENIDDEDLLNILNKCKLLLKEKGIVYIKENVVEDNEEVKINNIDYSRVRNDKLFKEIFKKAGLKVFKHIRHPEWPSDLMPVSIYILM